jgi:anti-sigma-K factor RskA
MSLSDQSKGDRSRDEVIAGEYVLGVLSSDDRRMVEERMLRDKPFASIVRRWEANLTSFDAEYASEVPPGYILPRIENRLFGSQAAARQYGIFSGVWNSVTLWRTSAILLATLCVTYGLYQTRVIGSPPPTTQMSAELVSDGSMVNLMARYDMQSGRLAVMPVATGKPQEKSLELWLMDSSGTPHSLGVLPATGDGEMIVPADMRQQFSDGMTIAVSLEPYGGSTTGLPTGPVIAAGKTYTP